MHPLADSLELNIQKSRSPLQRELALNTILRTCARLRGGRATRLDRNVLSSAFPPGPDSRPFVIQLSELLACTGDGIFSCGLVANGDCVVRKVVRKELVRTPASQSAVTPTNHTAAESALSVAAQSV